MTAESGDQRVEFALYLGKEHKCAYLPGRQARSLFFDPEVKIDRHLGQWLSDQGFRRSGAYMYRPYCEGCDACVPVRIPVDAFRPNRSQRRCQRLNQDLQVRLKPPEFDQEHFDLYRRYSAARHADGPMENLDPEQYLGFLSSPWSETRFCEFSLGEKLLAVAVTDQFSDGLSALYTFYDPELAQRSLGVLGVLWQIQQAQTLGLSSLYLGYWIRDCDKMNYKNRFRPLETWNGRTWRRYESGQDILQ